MPVAGRGQDGADVSLNERRKHRVKRRLAGHQLLVNPGLDVHSMLGEDPGLEQLLDAVNRQEAGNGSRQRGCDRHLDSVLGHHGLGEDLLREDPLDDGHRVGPHTHLDVERLTHEVRHLGSVLSRIVKFYRMPINLVLENVKEVLSCLALQVP